MARIVDLLVAALVMVGTGTSLSVAATSAQPQVAQRGRAIYAQQCALCHGGRGEGARGWQTRDAHGELPAPPHDSRGHTWKHSDEMLYRIVREGWRDPFNKTARMTMPAFKGRLSLDETVAVITYLKTLWSPQQRRFQAEESRGDPFPPEGADAGASTAKRYSPPKGTEP